MIDRISNFLCSIEKDKLHHFIAGSIICCVVVVLTAWIDGGLIASFLGFSSACIAGVAKELYDSIGKGTVDARDVLYTLAGGFWVSVIFTLVYLCL